LTTLWEEVCSILSRGDLGAGGIDINEAVDYMKDLPMSLISLDMLLIG
jgi:hypothetical protein